MTSNLTPFQVLRLLDRVRDGGVGRRAGTDWRRAIDTAAREVFADQADPAARVYLEVYWAKLGGGK